MYSFLSAPNCRCVVISSPWLDLTTKICCTLNFLFCFYLCIYMSDTYVWVCVEFTGAGVTGCEAPTDGHGNWTQVLWEISKSSHLLSHLSSPLPWNCNCNNNCKLFCPLNCILSGNVITEIPMELGHFLIEAHFLETPAIKIIWGLSLK